MGGFVDKLTSVVNAPFTGSALGFVGGILGNQETAKATAKSIDFQREMAKNAHQYEVQDLIAAGLNPILSAGGSGARASGGAQYKAENVLKDVAGTALQIQRQKEEIELLKAQTIKTTHEGEINKVGATVAQQILSKLGAPFSSAMDAMKSGYESIGELGTRLPTSAKAARIIAAEKIAELQREAKKAGTSTQKVLTIRIRKNSKDYK